MPPVSTFHHASGTSGAEVPSRHPEPPEEQHPHARDTPLGARHCGTSNPGLSSRLLPESTHQAWDQAEPLGNHPPIQEPVRIGRHHPRRTRNGFEIQIDVALCELHISTVYPPLWGEACYPPNDVPLLGELFPICTRLSRGGYPTGLIRC